MSLLAQIFTWWNGQTIGTRMFTSRKGQKVGEDSDGNLYYQTSDGVRRWVIFNGEAEASRVPPEWHGWLHHTWQDPPSEVQLPRKVWEKPHQPNLTGSVEAYHPPGSIRATQPVSRSDYEAWSPE
ncbi:MAG: NADH:ubiquinone oxidoreductase subunit NDUFA12 [Pseudomonadota bacterium]